MAQEAEPADTPPRRWRKRSVVGLAIRLAVLVGLAAALFAWSRREQIAYDFIADELQSRGVEATYQVTEISANRQVVTDIVIGDPGRPDLTVDRVEVFITPRLGLPSIKEVRLTRPRLFGSFRDGQLSFGALDPMIFTGSDEPFEFPDMVLSVNDGRGLIESDFGRIGLKLMGEGHLRGGFAGELALSAPQLEIAGCQAKNATLYGEVGVDAERPGFVGPLRFADIDCENGLQLADGGMQLELHAERNLSDFEGSASLLVGQSQFGQNRAASLSGESTFTWRKGGLTAGYDLAARDLVTSAAQIASLELTGLVRAPQGFDRLEVESEITGNGVRPGADIDLALAGAADAAAGTLAEPLLAKLRRNLGAELVGSRLQADITARSDGEKFSVVIPQANLRGRSGATLLALSRAQVSIDSAGESGGLPYFDGNLATGGQGLPRITGRMEQNGRGPLQLNLRMEEYSAGDARLAVPEIRVVQTRGGRIDFTGRASASGAIPGGPNSMVRGLQLPLDGSYSADGALELWNGCRRLSFDALRAAQLSLGSQTLTLCPSGSRPIVRFAGGALNLSAGMRALNLKGQLAGSPFSLKSGAVSFAMPGILSTSDVELALGASESAVRFSLADLTARFDGDEIAGTFAGTDVLLPAVPLDILSGGGDWCYQGGALTIANGAFTLEDRQQPGRFVPLIARGANLTFADNIIVADAILRTPKTGANVARADIVHDMSDGVGHADLSIGGITFNSALQPQDLSRVALGVVANVEGTVTGTGRIDWNADNVSSYGAFSSDAINLAAAFGQVERASGTVAFTDLLGMTTAPGQVIKLGAVNPGIEIFDGEVAFQLIGGEQLILERGSWPFLGGTLSMSPLTMNIGVAEQRTYEVVIDGLEASRFIERMELNNISATGTFDGSIPIVFDEDGNGFLRGGVLTARAPGGSLSYVGQLTYEDLSVMGNLAFQTLRDLKFDGAEILMDGPLTGELVTRVQFEGIGQGELAETNFITRQIAQLPIRLLLNIRAPFYKLMSSTRSLYDPSSVRDPRTLGLISAEGRRLRDTVDQQTVDDQDEQAAQEAEQRLLQSHTDEPDIQPTESEVVP